MLAVIGIIYGAYCAWVQKDVKKLVAYSSVSHLGFVMLGIFSVTRQGVGGAILQMVNHGISTGALFLLVGVIYERRHTRLLSDFGGLAKVMPLYTLLFVIVAMSSVGLPGTNGFIGEFMILNGTFMSRGLPTPFFFTAFATTGVILAAVYMLHAVLKMFWGPLDNDENKELADVGERELTTLAAAGRAGVPARLLPQPVPREDEPLHRCVPARLQRQAASTATSNDTVHILSLERGPRPSTRLPWTSPLAASSH